MTKSTEHITLTRNLFRIILSISVLVFSCSQTKAQTTSEPAYANMQRSIGGILQSVVQKQGFSTTDPRTYSTLYQAGRSAVSASAAVGTGFLVAGSSPAWATVLAASLIYAGVNYAVPIAFDASVQWLFPNSGSQISVTSQVPVTTTGIYSTAVQKFVDSNALPSGFTYVLSGLKGQASYSPCFVPADPGTGYYYVFRASTGGGCGMYNGVFSITGYDVKADSCPSGSTSLTWSTCTSSASAGQSQQIISSVGSLAEAVSLLTASQKNQPVDYKTMAMLINYLWQQASSKSDYSGIPFSTTSPVTSSDVQAWAQANPSAYPNLESLISPVTSSTGFSPSTSTSSGTPLNPATSSTSSSSTNSTSAQPQLNLGVDPNIGSPFLETTPTASQILAPILGLFPSFKNFTVPAHSGECPKPAFDAFGKHFVMDSHCTMFEQNRAVLTGAMLLAFSLVAIFIVLSA